MSKIVGIDLGTTNSSVAVVIDGKPQVIYDGNQCLIPSVVGLSPDGELLVGQAARNQYVLYPERTVKSIKRKMGSNEKVRMGDNLYTPQEISAFILKKLKKIAEDFLNEPVQKAVITVPAYFSDAQRQATKDAGEIAGLEVVRIINEPTAAALVYSIDSNAEELVMVYDLGGGTFDVSIVELNSGIIEVRASHGNNHLGGDDFDTKIIEHLVNEFKHEHALDLMGIPKALARIHKAAEAAKIKLSNQPYVKLSEEFIAKKGSFPVHLKSELSQMQFNQMIESLVKSTGTSIDLALADSQLKPLELDKILLVGGSTRIPLVWETVYDKMGKEPHSEINPDLAVALGAAVQAAIIAGEQVDAILVDVTPYSLGIEVADFKFGRVFDDRFSILIRRNTVIPVTISQAYTTLYPEQKSAHIKVYQGEAKTASENVLLGEFMFDNIPLAPDGTTPQFIIEFKFDVDGILHVAATHKETGRKEALSIKTSRVKLSDDEKQQAKEKLETMALTGADEVMPLIKKAEELLSILPNSEAKAELNRLVEIAKTEMAKASSEFPEELKDKLLDKMFELE